MKREKTDARQLGCIQLIGVAIGGTIASGVFSMSGDLAAAGAGTGAVLLGWGLCGLGMLAMVLCFYQMSKVRPELTGGIFSYAREGYGDYAGFNSAWGYWISNFLANVSFATLMFAAMGQFLPVFGQGNNGVSILCASAVTWLSVLLVLKGVNGAALVNLVVTFAKLVPILIFIIAILCLKAFDLQTFLGNFMGEDTGLSFGQQIRATSYTTAWAFIGLEGAIAVSGRAKYAEDAGKATVISYMAVLLLYMMISILSMGVMTRGQMAQLGNPPMAYILSQVMGPWGSIIINGGVIISLLGATLGHVIISAECACGAAQKGSFCKAFALENKKGAPLFALLVTNGLTQCFLIIVYLNASTYQIFYTISTAMMVIPYVLSAMYYWKLTGENPRLLERKGVNWKTARLIAIVGVGYGLWLIYSGGLTALMISALLYAPGTLIYIKGKREQGQAPFARMRDKILLTLILCLFVISLALLKTGAINPFK